MTELSSLTIALAQSIAKSQGNDLLLRLCKRARVTEPAANALASWIINNISEPKPWAIVTAGGDDAHSCKGWYYYLEEFPEAGSIGPNETRKEAAKMAESDGLQVRAQIAQDWLYEPESVELALSIDGDE